MPVAGHLRAGAARALGARGRAARAAPGPPRVAPRLRAGAGAGARAGAFSAASASAAAGAAGAGAAPRAAGEAFAELGVSPGLAAAVERDLGIRTPSAIQARAIPRLVGGASAALKCYTGSGKTLAYLLPVLTRLEREEAAAGGGGGGIEAIVVAPSAELAMQIVRTAQRLARRPEDVQQCIGGANRLRQIEALRKHRPRVVVGTPARLAQLSREGYLPTHHTRTVVLDEADQLTEPKLKADMDRIVLHAGKKVAGGRQTVLVSATMSRRLMDAAAQGRWMADPELISAGESPSAALQQGPGREDEAIAGSLSPTLEHLYVVAPDQHRRHAVERAVKAVAGRRVLVFQNMNRRLKDTAAKFAGSGRRVEVLHGQLRKDERKAVLDKFRRGKVDLLLVSGVAARGLDVPECDVVVNMDVPSDAAQYAHRAGRTGRAGQPGLVLNVGE